MSKTYYYKIYKDDFCYIGSTNNLKNRQNSHKYRCTNENSEGYNLKLYKTIRENGGWECFTFELIKQFDNLTKQEAFVIEQIYIEEFGNMNMKKSYISREEQLEQNNQRAKQYSLNNQDKIKERQQQYRLNNRDKILEQKKKYRLDNRDKIAEHHKQYYLNNQDKILERQKQYSLNNLDKIKEWQTKKITCECGCETTRGHLARHRKSKIHQDYLLIIVE
jgi:hypothetical protein